MSTQAKVKNFFSQSKVSKIWALHFWTFSSIQIIIINRRIFKFSFMMKYGEFETTFTKGKHSEQSIFPPSSTFLPWDLTFISLCNVKTSSKMSSLYKKDFAWGILFANFKNNWNIQSSLKTILNKEQLFCSQSDWWHSTCSAFFFEYNVPFDNFALLFE